MCSTFYNDCTPESNNAVRYHNGWDNYAIVGHCNDKLSLSMKVVRLVPSVSKTQHKKLYVMN